MVAIAAGGVAGIAVSRSGDASSVAGRTAGQTAGAAGQTDPIVRDGDRVVGQGTVIAPAGQPVRLCVRGAQVAIPDPPPPHCVAGVPVTGVDLDRLSSRQERYGTVWGGAWVEAVYRSGALTVTRQEDSRPGPGRGPDAGAADTVPCRSRPAAGPGSRRTSPRR